MDLNESSAKWRQYLPGLKMIDCIALLSHARRYCRYIDWLVQERRNSIANALELRLPCTNPSICHTNAYLSSVRLLLGKLRDKWLFSWISFLICRNPWPDHFDIIPLDAVRSAYRYTYDTHAHTTHTHMPEVDCNRPNRTGIDPMRATPHRFRRGYMTHTCNGMLFMPVRGRSYL